MAVTKGRHGGQLRDLPETIWLLGDREWAETCKSYVWSAVDTVEL